MKRLINRLICLIRGHRWQMEIHNYNDGFDKHGKYYLTDLIKCTRCGKIKEVRI